MGLLSILSPFFLFHFKFAIIIYYFWNFSVVLFRLRCAVGNSQKFGINKIVNKVAFVSHRFSPKNQKQKKTRRTKKTAVFDSFLLLLQLLQLLLLLCILCVQYPNIHAHTDNYTQRERMRKRERTRKGQTRTHTHTCNFGFVRCNGKL